ncbi:MAG: DUF7134 domain-containing protein [Sciscionella sp.]
MRKLSLWMRAHPIVGDSAIAALLAPLDVPLVLHTHGYGVFLIAGALLVLPLILRRGSPGGCGSASCPHPQPSCATPPHTRLRAYQYIVVTFAPRVTALYIESAVTQGYMGAVAWVLVVVLARLSPHFVRVRPQLTWLTPHLVRVRPQLRGVSGGGSGGSPMYASGGVGQGTTWS